MPASFDNACDCHVHIFDDAYPLAPTATFKPPHAPVADYREVQRQLQFTRVVIVQPTGYAFDNRCTLGAVEQLGPGARAIVVVPADTPDVELARMHAAGARGVRFMMLPGGVLPWSSLESIAARIAPLGWNINLQLDGRELPQHEATLRKLPCPLVIDHIGKFLGPTTPQDDGFLALRRLLDAGNCWIKLSAPYESSRTGSPAFEDVALLARTLASSYPDRCLWASNWPHPNVKPQPDNKPLLDWMLACTDHNEATQRKILVDNPARLYGF
ncbi:amidohydrolase family protein [Variovorax sp. J22R133]|uniref:amidohydrolase family protein n=1 Tax=Variovorax brevis TaxID=3053503 RepID=UPI002576C156|nr:amidohydrolase family protein [Variovorax sp. J22R133]MDM0111004.1 amidohydrolase family protein [Variovorax sp. J22R133]